jgi:hypothetical protein
VKTNAGSVKHGLKFSVLYGILPHYLPQGPLPDFEHCGYGVVLQMLPAFREPSEQHRADRQPFDSIRLMCTAYIN